ncbi:MAG TPA: hypothetical protein VFC39_02025 [Acidobacteriaceae bacterium]|nr:hypothetical protein [Acidobacteriaceae bacterium]
MFNRRPMLTSAASALAIGLFGFFSVMERPRFAAYHNVDILQLLASGMCFGVALTSVFVFFGIGRFAARTKAD